MFKKSLLSRLVSYLVLGMTEFDTGGGGGGAGGDPGAGAGGGQGGGAGQGGLTPPATNPWDSVPKSWAQETHAHWQTVGPDARKVIHDRETAFEKGYTPLKQRWDRLSQRFQEYTAQSPDMDLVGVYETLADNHLALSKAAPAERKTMLKELAKAYGVTFEEVQQAAQAAGATGQTQGPDVEKAVSAAVEKATAPFKQFLQNQHQQTIRGKVDAFFSAPENEFASAVAPDIMKLLNSGRVTDLPSAYKLACLENPEVAPKYLAKLAQSGAGGQDPGTPAGKDRNLRSTGEGAPSGKPKTMDDTMNAIAAKHYGSK